MPGAEHDPGRPQRARGEGDPRIRGRHTPANARWSQMKRPSQPAASASAASSATNCGIGVASQCWRRGGRASRLKALRIDVDDGGEPALRIAAAASPSSVAAASGDAARLLGLRHELGAVPAAQAQQRSRPEELLVRARPSARSASGPDRPGRAPRRRSGRGGGTADSRAPGAARSPPSGTHRRRAGPRSGSRARRAGRSGRARGRGHRARSAPRAGSRAGRSAPPRGSREGRGRCPRR